MSNSFGHYRLLGSLGQGGSGEVYRAQAPGGQPVALKVLRGPFSERRRKRVQVEIRTQQRLRHPAILPLIDAGWHGELAYLVFPFAEGGTLEDRMRREGALGQRGASELMRRLAQGLAHAHEHGVLHRDLKPDNVLMTDRGPQLIDFGLAQELEASYSRLTTSGTFLGTPGFWSPEQAQGELETLGPPTDVYGLGATVYAALAGQPPFVADTVGGLLEKFMSMEPPEPLARLRPDVDPRLTALCMRCLRYDPQARPTLSDVLAELDAIEGGPPAPRSGRRGLALAAGPALLAVAGLGAALWATRDPTGTVATSPDDSGGGPDGAAGSGDPGGNGSADNGPDAPAGRESKDGPPTPLDQLSDEQRGPLAIGLAAFSNAALDLGSLALCQHYAEVLVRLAPDWGYSYFRRGNAHYFQGRYQPASDDYAKALTLGLERPHEALLNLGTSLARLGQPDAARTAYAEGLRLAPDWGELLRTAANLDMAEGRIELALTRLTRALELEPDHPLALCNRGTALYRLGRFPEAEQALERCVEVSPGLALGWENLGLARQARGELPGALEAFDRALRLQPLAKLHVRKANALQQGQQFEAALAELERALELDPNSHLAWLNCGEAQLTLGRPQESEAAFARAQRLAPDDPRAYAGLGRVRANLGDERGAIAAYDRGLQLDPRNLPMLQNRGNAYARLGEYPPAIESYTRALELDPNTWRARLFRGRVHKLMGSNDLARADLEQVAERGPAALATQARELLRDLP